MFKTGDRVEIAYNPPSPADLTVRKNRESYQTRPDTGTIVGFHMENDERYKDRTYMVRVDLAGHANGRLRVIPERKLKAL